MRTGQHLEAVSATFGLVASIALHLAVLATITATATHFDFDFELTLPAEVEFGLTGEMAMAAASSRATGAPAARRTLTPGDHEREPTPDAGVPMDPDTGPDTGPNTDTGIVSPPTLTGPSRIPPGAQLALRIDMRRVRESPLAPDVTAFLRGVPDWQLLLDGSGIDPVADLDRLLVATPNLQRSKLVLAGRHRRDESFARNSARRLARSRGKVVRWRRLYGVAAAPWHNRDRTPRTIALLSAHHFSITRPQDLQRVLAMTKARERRDAKKEGLIAAQGPDALLSMGPDEVISLEIEGVHRFVIGSVKHVPLRLRLAVRETGPDEATVSVMAIYASENEARAASVYWRKVAAFYSQQLIMTLAGFGKTLRHMGLEPADDRIQISFTLNADQIRFILSYAEGRLRGAASSTARPRQGLPPTKKEP